MKKDNKTYSEAMNDWKLQEAERSFMGKFRSSIFHPRYDATWSEKLLGYVFRIGSVAVVGGLGLFFFARFQAKSKGYRAHIAETLAQHFHGTNATIGPLAWQKLSTTMSFKSLAMDGKPESFFRRLEATAISLELGGQFLSDTWEFDKLNIHEVTMELKNGGLGSRETHAPGGRQPSPEATPNRVFIPDRTTGAVSPALRPNAPAMLTAGFAMRPDPSKLVINGYYINSLTCNWGYSETNRGGLSEATTILVKHEKKPQTWVMTCSSGKFSQNWIKNVDIEKFQAEVSQTGIEIVAGSTMRVGPSGRLFIHGPITVEEVPKIDLAVTLKDVNLRELCPQAMHKFFMGTVSGQGKITGTTNNESGVKMNIKVNLVPPARTKLTEKLRESDNDAKLIATLTELPLLKSLYKCTLERGFDNLRFTEGSFTLETGEQQLNLHNIDLVAPLGRLRGELHCEETLIPNLAPKPGEKSEIVGYLFSGDLLFGIAPAISANIPAPIRDRFVLKQKTADGLEWIKVTLKNDTGDTITRAVSNEMDRLLREGWDKPQTPAAQTPESK